MIIANASHHKLILVALNPFTAAVTFPLSIVKDDKVVDFYAG